MFGLASRRELVEQSAAADVVRYRTRVGDLVEVADLSIALEQVGAPEAARHFRRLATVLRDEHAAARGDRVAFSRRLGDPYCVFDPVDPTGTRWAVPRWIVDSGQVLLLVDDVVAVALALSRAGRAGFGGGWSGRSRPMPGQRGEARALVRFARELAGGSGPVVALACLPVDQSLA